MAPNKFSKKTSTTYSIVYRPQNDPLIHDDSAPGVLFAEKASQPSSSSQQKIKTLGDLGEEFGTIRENEGEAAEHGVFYDDSRYDYMQHLRDLGGNGNAVWMDAAPASKGKGQERLEDALRGLDVDDTRSVVSASSRQSYASSRQSYASSRLSYASSRYSSVSQAEKRMLESQQSIPSSIAGFQPDMDPALREVLEALEDDAYVDNEDEEDDFFAELTREGEIDDEMWEATSHHRLLPDDDDNESETSTLRASSPPPALSLDTNTDRDMNTLPPPESSLQTQPPSDPTSGAWLDEYAKFKSRTKSPQAPSAMESLSSLATGRRKKRKGAKTSTTISSMTSASLARTEDLSTLDSRFDRFEATYDGIDEDDGDEGSLVSGVSGASRASAASRYSNVSGVSAYSRADDAEAPKLVRGDFDRIVDDFLAGSGAGGRRGGRRGRKGAAGDVGQGMRMLDEVRRGLGPARVGG